MSQLPPPPPSVPNDLAGMMMRSRLLLAGVFVLLFGRCWLSVERLDWLGVAAACALALCVLSLEDKASRGRRVVASSLFLGLAYALLEGFPARIGGFSVETLAASGFGLAAGVAGLALGFWGGRGDRWMGCALLALAAGTLLMAGAALALPDGASWSRDVPAQVSSALEALRRAGGLQRWLSVGALYAFWLATSRTCD